MADITKRRILEMDVIRALAIVAVIVLHVSATILYRSTPYSTTYNANFILNQFSRFCVPAFIIISGMGLTISYKEGCGYFKFIIRRFLKIVPQYIVWCLLYIIIITKDFNIHTDLNNIVYGNVFYHFYFVPLIIEFYIIFPFIYKFMEKKWWLLLSFLMTSFFIVYTYYFKIVTPDQWFWNKKNLFYWIFYFSLGGYMGKNLDNISQKLKEIRPIVCVMFLLSIFTLLYSFITGNQYGKSIDYITTFQRPSVIFYSTFFVIFIFSFEWKKGLFMKIVRYISNTSYDIYLSQAGILYLYTQYYIGRYVHVDNLSFGVNAFAVTLIGSIALNEIKKLL